MNTLKEFMESLRGEPTETANVVLNKAMLFTMESYSMFY